jgi:hypothetical protein
VGWVCSPPSPPLDVWRTVQPLLHPWYAKRLGLAGVWGQLEEALEFPFPKHGKLLFPVSLGVAPGQGCACLTPFHKTLLLDVRIGQALSHQGTPLILPQPVKWAEPGDH